jgi:hypothetical protein
MPFPADRLDYGLQHDPLGCSTSSPEDGAGKGGLRIAHAQPYADRASGAAFGEPRTPRDKMSRGEAHSARPFVILSKRTTGPTLCVLKHPAHANPDRGLRCAADIVSGGTEYASSLGVTNT